MTKTLEFPVKSSINVSEILIRFLRITIIPMSCFSISLMLSVPLQGPSSKVLRIIAMRFSSFSR